MKKYLIPSIVAIALGGMFASCSNDEDYGSLAEAKVKAYEENFINVYGTPAPQHNWGFKTVATPETFTARTTRAITVGSDVYNEFYWPENVDYPGGAFVSRNVREELPTNGNYDYYVNNGEGMNYKITEAGEYNIGGSWQNIDTQGNLLLYNIYVYLNDGEEVTLKRNGAAHFNLYVIRGTANLVSNYGEQAGSIYVCEEGTLIDNRTSLAANNGITVYNNGTYIANNEAGFDIGNNAAFYNQKNFRCVGPLSYSAGAGNTSFLYNVGDDAVLTAPSMTMNSTCHFFTQGKVNITGETKVTQNNIIWVNDGHYTTGSMVFSAYNGTFYNYCQLIVTNNCNFTDGKFNMMKNSYAEFGTGLFNNFYVTLDDNAGFNVLRGSKWGRQAQGTFQGFEAKNDDVKVYVRLAGETSVPSHNGAAFHAKGANLTLACENIKFYNTLGVANIGLHSVFDDVTYSDETTAEALAGDKDGRITWNVYNAKIVPADDFSETGFTLKEGECKATWKGDPGDPVDPDDPDPINPTTNTVICGRIFCEDMARAADKGDIDFNDVVFDVFIVTKDGKQNTEIQVLAAGGTLPITVAGENIHALFNNTPETTMINTVGDKTLVNSEDQTTYNGVKFTNFNEVKTITLKNTNYTDLNSIPIMVRLNNVEVLDLTNQRLGSVPHKICVPIGTRWPQERIAIDEAYPDFEKYVKDPETNPWQTPDTENEWVYAWNYTDDSKLESLGLKALGYNSWADVPYNETIDLNSGGSATQLWPEEGTSSETSLLEIAGSKFTDDMAGMTLRIYSSEFSVNYWSVTIWFLEGGDNFSGLTTTNWSNNWGHLASTTDAPDAKNGDCIELTLTSDLIAKFKAHGMKMNLIGLNVSQVTVE